MNTSTVITPTSPKTLQEVKALPNHVVAFSMAGAHNHVANLLPCTPGPLASKKLFAEGNHLVYEFYRVRNKTEKIYVIF